MLFAFCSCGGTSRSSTSTPGMSSGAGVPASQENPATADKICNCISNDPASSDYRHNAKHSAVPVGAAPQEISVNDIISWGFDAEPAFDAPRSGRELQLFHVPQAFVQFVWLVPNDCDVHMEISATSDKGAPRVIVETPVDGSFCATRQALVSGFARYGVMISVNGFETAQGIPVDVLGLAFRDFVHSRGTTFVNTPWELHPAIVTVK